MKEDITSKIIEWVENVANLASSELPDFIREVCTYGFYSNLFEAVVWLILCVVGAKVSLHLYKAYLNKKKNPVDKWDDGFNFIAGTVIFSIVTLLFLMGFGYCTQECIKAKVSPKLYVIERFIKK